MKNLIVLILIFLITSGIKSQSDLDLSTYTVGGNNNRTGYKSTFFDHPTGFSRTYNAPYSIWGMPVFSNQQYFATTRYTSLSPLKAMIAAFDYNVLNPIWTYGENSGVNIIMGFRDNKIYVRDFQQNGNDTIFALNASDGSLIWKSRFTVERGIIWTAVFAPNGDLILPGSGTKRIMRINHLNGDTVWTNSRIIPNTGAETMCINGNTLYAWEGGLTTPKTIIAIDLATGIKKYSSATLPGDGDQEIPFTVSSNGVVYCIRDGGLMYALKDNGTGFTQLWSRIVIQPVGTYTQIATARDSSVYIPFGKKICRLNHLSGEIRDSSIDLVTSGNINPRFVSGIFQTIFVGNGADNPSEGKFFAFSKDLQTVHWTKPAPYNYYCGPVSGNNNLVPTLLMTAGGTEISSIYNYVDNIVSLSSEQPDKFTLMQNYPNPFNPVTNLEFGISDPGFVTLKIYDMLGKELITLLNSELAPGKYKVQFDGANYTSGMYFYKLTAGKFTETKKMDLIK
ncbi:MAG TPA: T9SS type A sorting domain-containing protein [Ignavibacteria bacterium]|nr:T9SS type A sorting domain-containing protein [Ignavibacteria bacterium]